MRWTLCVGMSKLYSQTPRIGLDWFFCSKNPLASKIATVSLPPKFRVSKVVFEGRRDPRAHLMQYNDYMNLLGASNVAKCKAFSTTLRGSAKDWYLSLPQGSIRSFTQLGQMFFLEDFSLIEQS